MLLGTVTLFALVGTMWVYISGLQISSDITKLEVQTRTLSASNLDLLETAQALQSLAFVASASARLGFVTKAQPIYFDRVKTARR